jgi:peptidoglycan/LPS O-acetylase OafA/YrhL
LLLLVPGMVGGGLAGVVSPVGARWQGAAVGGLFGLSVALVKVFVAPSFGYQPTSVDLAIYPALIVGLVLAGAGGGLIAQRWRPANRVGAAVGRQSPVAS